MIAPRSRTRLAPLLLAVLAWSPAAWNGLVWDDEVIAEFQLGQIDGLGDALVPPAGIANWSYGYYRPVLTLSQLADARLFGPGAAAGPHVVNLLLHVLATGLVLGLARRALGRGPPPAAAAAGAALFAVHPVHAESVAWIAGRSDLLATVLLLGALLAALGARDGRGARALVALAAAPLLLGLALLAKESAVAGLALLPALLLLAPRAGAAPGAGARSAAVLALCAAATAGWAALRAHAGVLPAPPVAGGPAQAAATALAATGYYLRMLVLPWPQSALPPWSLAPAPAAGAALVAGALALTAWSAARWRRAGDGAGLLAWAWLWATLAVPAWIAVTAANNTPLAERYLYLPSVALALGAAALARSPRLAGRAGGALLALLVAAGTAASLQRTRTWHDGHALWTDATRLPGASGLAWLNLGMDRLEAGDDAAALAALVRVGGDPAVPPRWRSRAENGLGTIALRRGDLAEAEARLRAAARAEPANPEPHHGLAAVQRRRAEAAQAAGDRAARDAAAEAAVGALVAALARNALWHAARLALADQLVQHADWLAADGAAAAAARRYRAALGQLDELDARLPAARRDEALGRLRERTGLEPAALRSRAAAGLAALRGEA